MIDSKPLKKHKRRFSLLPLSMLRDVYDVMADAVDRGGYKEHSWKHCPPEEAAVKYGEALFRHLDAWQDGEWRDPDSQLPHLAHAVANGLILLWHGKRDPRARRSPFLAEEDV